ncbi:MAG: glycosyltransferase [Bacteroidales bacterium]|nr:glycosyltransferase [Bacteroidales bacterium]
MRVAIIIPRLEELGPVKVIQTLINYLCKTEELQIKIFYLDKTIDDQIKMMVPVERLDRKHFCFEDYDIIHTNGIRPDLFAFINRKKIRYHISTIHNFVFEDLSFTYNKLISWMFGNLWLVLWRRADKLVCVSNVMKDYYSKWFPVSKLEVIHNGITGTENLSMYESDIINEIENFHLKGFKVIGAAGILTKRKGIDHVLNFLAKEKEFALLIFGTGKELDTLQRLAKRLDISDRCMFCGFKSNAVKYFKYFDFIIVPSRSEGFCLTLVEAVQQKVPVICSDIDVFRELFNSDEVTFYRVNDTNSLSEAMKVSMERGNDKIELAYTRYLNNYTDQLMAKKYYELYMSA